MPLTTITISKLDRIAVRTSLVNPADSAPCQDGSNKGSGLLIGTKRKWYVLTAKHCVRDKKKEEILVQLKNEDGTVRRLNVYDVKRDDAEEWALLEVERPRHKVHYSEVRLGNEETIHTVRDRDAFAFRGYPVMYRDGQTLDLKFNSTNEWYVKGRFDLAECSFADYIEGFSGSGIVTELDRKIYCVGIVEEVKGTTGLYGTVRTTQSSFYAQALAAKGEVDFMKALQKASKEKAYEEPVEYITRYCRQHEDDGNLGFIFLEEEKHTLLAYVSGRVDGCDAYHYILTGDAQSGKTYEMHHLACELEKDGYDVRFLTHQDFQKLKEIEDEENIAILIDALDESPDGSFDDIIFAISECANRHLHNLIVVSTRDGYVKHEQLTGFCRLRLEDLSGSQIDERIFEKCHDAEKLFAQIRVSGLADQIGRPYFLDYVIKRFNEGLELPTNNALLYQGWVKDCCRLVANKHPELAPDENSAYIPLLMMALAMQLTTNVTIKGEDLKKVVGEDGVQLLNMNKLVVHNEDGYTFVHNSVREFLVAEHLLSLSEEKVRTYVCYYETETINPVWTNVTLLWLQLLCQRDGQLGQSLIQWLVSNTEARNLLVSCDKSCIAEETRFEVFRVIIEDVSRKGRYLSWFDNSFLSRLVHFAEGKQFAEYLEAELAQFNVPCPSYYNLMLVTTMVDWQYIEQTAGKTFTRLRNMMITNLEVFRNQSPDSGFMYFLLSEKFYSDSQIIGRVFNLFGEDDRKDIISSLLSLIVRADRVDDYMDYITDKSKPLSARDSNIYLIRTLQYKALSSAKSVASVLAALTCASSSLVTDSIYNQDEYLEMVVILLQKVRQNVQTDNCKEISSVVSRCFLQRFEGKQLFVEARIRQELDAYRNLLTSIDGWSDELEVLYSELYNRGVITPEQEAEIRSRRQKDFDEFCDYETFKVQVLDVVQRYEKSGSHDWLGFGIDTDGHYNDLLNRYLAELSGIREMNPERVRVSISNEASYNCYRMRIVEQHLYRKSKSYEISDKVMDAVIYTATALLKEKIAGKTIGIDNLKSALHLLIAGKVVLPDEELLAFLEYSHECISGDIDIDNYSDSVPLLSTMRNQLGDEKLSAAICDRLKEYRGGSHLYFIQWMRYLLDIDCQPAKELLIHLMKETKNEALRDSILSMLIEHNKGIDEICKMMPEMSNEDLVHCCNELEGQIECKDIICELLEARLETFEGYYLKMCLRILFRMGSMKALMFAAGNTDLVGQNSEDFEFYYSSPEALPFLSALLPVVQQNDYVRRATTSIIDSMGNIAETSDKEYHRVCAELDNCMKQEPKLSFLENTKVNFYKRLLQRKEHKMNIEEAIQNIEELCQKYQS